MLFSKLILITALIPIFTFQRVEGRIFRPMAFTIAGAIIGATLVTLTLVPLACSFLLRRAGMPRTRTWITRRSSTATSAMPTSRAALQAADARPGHAACWPGRLSRRTPRHRISSQAR